jgi:hypothetical protein
MFYKWVHAVHVLQMSPVQVLQMSPVQVLQMSPVQVLQVQSSPGFTTCRLARLDESIAAFNQRFILNLWNQGRFCSEFENLHYYEYQNIDLLLFI